MRAYCSGANLGFEVVNRALLGTVCGMSWTPVEKMPLVDADQGLDLSPALALADSLPSSGVPSTGRADSDLDVEMLETDPQEITDNPLRVDAFVDGIQAVLTLTYNQSRPIRLAHIAAGAAVGFDTSAPDLAGLVEKVTLVASEQDRQWLSEMAHLGEMPMHFVQALTPPEVESATTEWISGFRDKAELQLTNMMLDAGIDLLGLDGHLLNRPHNPRLFGVVKSVQTKYLPDESVLWNLKQGWRSPIFRMPSRTGDRFSCYVRLQSIKSAPWSHGLIRVESFEPATLPALAATVLTLRQESGSSDPRWDRHLHPVRVTEQLLRSRRPSFF